MRGSIAIGATGTNGRLSVNASRGTTVTAPGTPWLLYMIGPVGTVPGAGVGR